jgi:hypothetical protein
VAWTARWPKRGRPLLLTFCILAFGFFTFTRPHHYQLALELASASPSTATLFFDDGQKLSPANSRTVPVYSRSLTSFQTLTFDLPHRNISRFVLYLSKGAGPFAIKNVVVRSSQRILLRIPDQALVSQGGIANPSVVLQLSEPLHLQRVTILDELGLWVIGSIPLLVAGLLLFRFEHLISKQLRQIDSRFSVLAERLSRNGFLRFNANAVWFYVLCLLCFFLAVAADFNGSSIAVYSSVYKHGPAVTSWIGAPREIRSDEWGYETPAILNQALRAQPFEVEHSVVGGHSASLTANLPVRHISAFFRPQFWGFFVLPLDYAFSFYWQAKALLLVCGVFTFLLLLTRSTFWSAIGSLWFFFSPSMQWSYSWASALPEMIGLACLAVVVACYLAVARNAVTLVVAALALAVCAVDFALCAYLPHLVPLCWVVLPVLLVWLYAARRCILTRRLVWGRAAAAVFVIATVALVGASVYADLHQAVVAILATSYPGKRVMSGGMLPLWQLPANFFPWFETEKHFPAALGNISEGSGFLWLAPATLLCFRHCRFSRFERLALFCIWGVVLLLLSWLLLPLPPAFGAFVGLNRVPPTRAIPALGLANVAIVSLCMARLQTRRTAAHILPYYSWLAAIVSFAGIFFFLRSANQHLGTYFSQIVILASALITTILLFLLVTGRKRAFAAVLLVPHVLAFGSVNPVERGLSVFTSSDLFRLVQSRPELKQKKWIVFSDSVISSGFFQAAGCDVYTGLRYIPDIDHFPLFASRGMNLEAFNRLGYLVAHPLNPGASPSFNLRLWATVEWNVAPSDPMLRSLGIEYIAFDQPPRPAWSSTLVPIANGPVDGFWLYRLP